MNVFACRVQSEMDIPPTAVFYFVPMILVLLNYSI